MAVCLIPISLHIEAFSTKSENVWYRTGTLLPTCTSKCYININASAESSPAKRFVHFFLHATVVGYGVVSTISYKKHCCGSGTIISDPDPTSESSGSESGSYLAKFSDKTILYVQSRAFLMFKAALSPYKSKVTLCKWKLFKWRKSNIHFNTVCENFCRSILFQIRIRYGKKWIHSIE